MMGLHKVIGDMPELVFISDRCTYFHRAVYRVLLNALFIVFIIWKLNKVTFQESWKALEVLF